MIYRRKSKTGPDRNVLIPLKCLPANLSKYSIVITLPTDAAEQCRATIKDPRPKQEPKIDGAEFRAELPAHLTATDRHHNCPELPIVGIRRNDGSAIPMVFIGVQTDGYILVGSPRLHGYAGLHSIAPSRVVIHKGVHRELVQRR